MSTFLEMCLLALFVVPFVRDRRAMRRRLDASRFPQLDRPPVAAAQRLPRGWARRRYVDAGVAEVAAYLNEQDPAR
ncbi:hypothetical protein [Kineococcus aurantiacus]|uniref:Uncharacterized protein n=1 Tax=Kineococcus aurantiacus TaxID=37633 RepID=A0A7Y9DPI9_9ACTN|nr:hypothetical protein [Kineococcus aurantiacus]NYD24417.1 hypothetical protein [Kineococcus aurantiacus]